MGRIAKNVQWSIVVVPMKSSKKTIVLSLLLAVAFFTSGSCVFPMASAQAAAMDMSDMSMGEGDEVQNIHCSDRDGSGCGLTQDQTDFSDCSSCGSPATKTAVVKKIQDTPGLPTLNHLSESFLSEAYDVHPVPHALTSGGGRERLLLSVAKKE